MEPKSSVPRVFLVAAFSLLLGPILRGEQTALDRYVATPDPSYSFHEVAVHDDGDSKTHILEMTSQAFLTEKEVDLPIWKHWLTIIVPDQVKSSTGLLFITGGSNDRPAPRIADRGMVTTAQVTHTVVAELRDVPNEPLVFSNDGKKRVEDAIIAYTWDKFLKTGDEKWPLRLPMTKAAVRAMDTVTTFCKALPMKVRVERFVVAGASKRGWTTWTTAAVDKRVIAIVPIVIDTLNLDKQAGRQPRAYGFYSSAVKDYTDTGLPKWKGTPQFKALERIEDPYSYRDRYTMPKLLINSTGDQYFLPDSSQFYFDDLPGVKYLRYVPNTDHSLAGSDAAQSLQSFYGSIVGQRKLPRFTWTLQKDGGIEVQAQDRPAEVNLWRATNPKARDFRLQVLGPKWTSTPLAQQGEGAYLAKVDPPAQGWTAFMVELTYPNPGLPPLKFTTQVRIVPNTMPYPEKQDAPTGRL